MHHEAVVPVRICCPHRAVADIKLVQFVLIPLVPDLATKRDKDLMDRREQVGRYPFPHEVKARTVIEQSYRSRLRATDGRERVHAMPLSPRKPHLDRAIPNELRNPQSELFYQMRRYFVADHARFLNIAYRRERNFSTFCYRGLVRRLGAAYT